MKSTNIRTLIQQAKMDAAIQLIIQITSNTDLANAASAISNQYKKYKSDLMLGFLSREEDDRLFATITHRALGLLNEFDQYNQKVDLHIEDTSTHNVFISYAWGGESEKITNQIDEAFQRRGVNIIRDKRHLPYKRSIKDFMKHLGNGKSVIIVISDKYLKSKNCLFELLEISSNGSMVKRIFPIVLEDARIFDAKDLLVYIKYWEVQIKELEQAIREVSLANLHGIREDLDLYTKIRAFLPEITNKISDMNTLTMDIHRDDDFQELYKQIIATSNL